MPLYNNRSHLVNTVVKHNVLISLYILQTYVEEPAIRPSQIQQMVATSKDTASPTYR